MHLPPLTTINTSCHNYINIKTNNYKTTTSAQINCLCKLYFVTLKFKIQDLQSRNQDFAMCTDVVKSSIHRLWNCGCEISMKKFEARWGLGCYLLAFNYSDFTLTYVTTSIYLVSMSKVASYQCLRPRLTSPQPQSLQCLEAVEAPAQQI